VVVVTRDSAAAVVDQLRHAAVVAILAVAVEASCKVTASVLMKLDFSSHGGRTVGNDSSAMQMDPKPPQAKLLVLTKT